jgi:hypothetical protein
MRTYLARPCPRCNGYLGIVLREPGRNTSLRGINGHCVQCGHRLAWILIRGKKPPDHSVPTPSCLVSQMICQSGAYFTEEADV